MIQLGLNGRSEAVILWNILEGLLCLWKDLLTWDGCTLLLGGFLGLGLDFFFLRAEDYIRAGVNCSMVTSHLHALGM